MSFKNINIFKQRKVRDALFSVPYVFLLLVWIAAFSLINVYTNQLYVTGAGVFNYPMHIWLPYLLFTIANTLLVGLVINLIIMRIHEAKALNPTEGTLSAFGAFVALLTGACPGCIAGLFPAVAGIFGSTMSLSSLPFFGLELQILSFVLLYLGCVMLSKPMVCAVKKK